MTSLRGVFADEESDAFSKTENIAQPTPERVVKCVALKRGNWNVRADGDWQLD
ncbi:hypothetical protein [Bosea sp. LjRoot237]|uniref:hypothetical protein n=1 Tax=Bosea sp. LjRoot237 TaxID=3342292 RepID=UPI003ECDEB43